MQRTKTAKGNTRLTERQTIIADWSKVAYLGAAGLEFLFLKRQDGSHQASVFNCRIGQYVCDSTRSHVGKGEVR